MEVFWDRVKSFSQRTVLFAMGQAGFIIKSGGGQTIGIDLYLSDCVEVVEGHVGYHRLMPRIVEPEDLKLDVLIATHFHRDHYDIDSIPKLMAKGQTCLYCASDCKEDVDNSSIDKNRVMFVRPSEQYVCGDFNLYFVHCDHGTGAPQAVGVIIEVDGKRILEVGDTCLHLDWVDEYLSQGPLDVLIAPINGAFGNLDEEENVMLTKVLQPKLTVPCHFGMFASHGGNPGLWKELMDTQLPKQNYKLFTQGEGIIIK